MSLSRPCSSSVPPTPTTGCRNSSRASSSSSSRRSRPSCSTPRAESQMEQRLFEFPFTLTVRALASFRESWLRPTFTHACLRIPFLLSCRTNVATLVRFMVTPVVYPRLFSFTLTFRALHGNHIVSISGRYQHNKEPTTSDKQTDRRTARCASTFHDTQYAFLPFSVLISLIPMFFVSQGTIEQDNT